MPTAQAAQGGFNDWEQALDLVTTGLDGPLVIVIDEFPWLLEMDRTIEGRLQRVWDRVLKDRPVMLVLIGSDLAMMEALTEYGRPLYDRARIVNVRPLSPAAVGELTGQRGPEAFEAWAITGGFPNLALEWQPGQTLDDFLRDQLADPGSRLIVSGERKLAAEFPADSGARIVLEAIGSGAREHKRIAARAGLPTSSLERALGQLVEKGAVAKEVAYSTVGGRNTRYLVADAHLRFWLRFISTRLSMIERGATEQVLDDVRTGWSAWRGEAIEPIIRESAFRLLVRWPEATDVAHVGQWWRRDHSMQIDIVAGDRAPVANKIVAVGSIKWRDRERFSARDAAELITGRTELPGGRDALLIGCSATGFDADLPLDAMWQPNDLLDSWT